MQLKHHEPEYYHALYNKICDMPFGETPLTHKDNEQKEKFENHIKHWISIDEFRVFNFYILFSNEYDKLLKFEYPFNRMEQLKKSEDGEITI